MYSLCSYVTGWHGADSARTETAGMRKTKRARPSFEKFSTTITRFVRPANQDLRRYLALKWGHGPALLRIIVSASRFLLPSVVSVMVRISDSTRTSRHFRDGPTADIDVEELLRLFLAHQLNLTMGTTEAFSQSPVTNNRTLASSRADQEISWPNPISCPSISWVPNSRQP